MFKFLLFWIFSTTFSVFFVVVDEKKSKVLLHEKCTGKGPGKNTRCTRKFLTIITMMRLMPNCVNCVNEQQLKTTHWTLFCRFNYTLLILTLKIFNNIFNHNLISKRIFLDYKLIGTHRTESVECIRGNCKKFNLHLNFVFRSWKKMSKIYFLFVCVVVVAYAVEVRRDDKVFNWIGLFVDFGF